MQEEARKPEIATVDLDTLEHENPRTVGCERLCLKALDDLGFAEILHGLDIKGRDGRIASALIVARMVHPASERDTSRWLRHDSAAAELLGLEGDRKALRRKTLYRIGDLLWRHRAAIQRELFNRERALLDLPETIAFYDLTNVHYHGHTDGELPRFGRSKQKRDDCPLITLALALDGAGFPRSCEILPRQRERAGHAARGAGPARGGMAAARRRSPPVVMDAGIATRGEHRLAGRAGLRLDRGQPRCQACAARGRTRGPADHQRAPTRCGPGGLPARTARRGSTSSSEGKKKAENAIIGLRRNRFEAALQRLHGGLAVKRRLKRYDKVLESIGRLKQRFSAVARHYEITVEKADTGPNATAVRFKRRPPIRRGR